ncbi:MAG: acyl carrier protein [Bacillota bacterium]|nr:acyl carrier protein [Bacillota bacterium]
MADKVFEKVRHIIAEQVGYPDSKEDIKQDSDLEELGADSLDVMTICVDVEEEFGIEIPDDVAEAFKTVDDLVEYVKQHT